MACDNACTAVVYVFDAALFREQFPAFANSTTFPDAMLQMYWDMAVCYIDDVDCGWLNGNCRLLAINMMTAHLTALSVIVAGGEIPGVVINATIDKINVGLMQPPSPNQWQWWLNITPYGQQLLALLQVNSAGGFWVGGLPELSAFRRVGGGFYS